MTAVNPSGASLPRLAALSGGASLSGGATGPGVRAAVFRRPRRITITVADGIYQRLAQQSDEQGRSLSNLAAYLIEAALQAAPPAPRCAG